MSSSCSRLATADTARSPILSSDRWHNKLPSPREGVRHPKLRRILGSCLCATRCGQQPGGGQFSQFINLILRRAVRVQGEPPKNPKFARDLLDVVLDEGPGPDDVEADL